MHIYWYNVEYKGLHAICSFCGCYGHGTRYCPNKTEVVKESPSDDGAMEVTIDTIVHGSIGQPMNISP